MTKIRIINAEKASEYYFTECERFLVIENSFIFGSDDGRTTLNNFSCIYGASTNEIWVEVPEKEYSEFISKRIMTNTQKGE